MKAGDTGELRHKSDVVWQEFDAGVEEENCSCMRCEKPGYVQLARPDGRRGVWARAMGDEINICAGREGDDVFLSLKVGEVVGERHVKLFGEILQTYAWSLQLQVDNVDSQLAQMEG